MTASKLTSKSVYELHFTKFREGNEKGLEFFYKIWYPILYYRGLRYIKDDVNADCIVNEAFLRLWLFRNKFTAAEQIEVFVKKLTSDGCKAYFKAAKHTFQRNMLRLDELENYQEFIGSEDTNFESEDMNCDAEPDEEIKKQWAEVEKVIPNLSTDQQLFIRLCIKYAFDYGRVAWHIGGISDDEVARKVEKTLVCLKAILMDTRKLDGVGKANKCKFEGDVAGEQLAILRMRYELQYSFEEIARHLNLNQGYIQKTYVDAMAKVRKVKR
ncbi:sigma factor-like helix-turn-helix DNA-binding protein [Pedobacter lithocola]|uniref:Sigma factor-like helix-turn-helix DNA-binding protein n=1 Tax=Pedobacter lithocola TaxID=1908239 RepID=A0ABV8PBJ1_9SPHI